MGVGQGCFEAEFKLAKVRLALILGEDAALRVDEVGDGESKDAAVEVAEVLVAHDYGVGELIFAVDLLDRRGVVVH
jgi:hypothetical protein